MSKDHGELLRGGTLADMIEEQRLEQRGLVPKRLVRAWPGEYERRLEHFELAGRSIASLAGEAERSAP